MFKRVGLSISRITSTSTKRSFVGLSSKKAFPNRISSYSQRLYSTHNFNDVKLTDEAKEALKAERDADEADVVIVGGGPAGLSAAIRIKQLCNEQGKDLRVVLLEKGADVGNHILSGAVLDPRYFQQMFPDWKEMGAPLNTPVTSDQFKFLLNDNTAVPLPIPPSLHNDGNYIVSLGEVCRWLGEQAEALGVEVFPGFAASELLRDESGAVCGVATADSGISKSGDLKGNFARGMELRAPVTLLAEGCRGSLTGQAEQWFNLGEKRLHPQSYGIGLKEVWSVAEGKHNPGHVLHTAGWPVDNETYAGSFLYHLNGDDRLVALGYVVGLDYKNPFLNPYKEFQKLKHHSVFKEILEGGECVAYGARALNEGGYQAIPKLYFPGGALLGCAAGFLNLPKIKGSHNAMLSGMLAGEAVVDKLLADSKASGAVELDNYSAKMLSSDAVAELKAVRNIRPAFTSPLGNVGGILYAAANDFVTKGKEPWTLTLKHADHETLRPAKDSKAPEYAAPDGKLSFDLLTNLSRANTNHEEDQPPHLRVQNPALPVDVNLDVYDGPEQRFCPAGVYEFVDDSATGGKKLQINAQNCIHCKTCSIKDPSQNIRWTVPENGGGPNYGSM